MKKYTKGYVRNDGFVFQRYRNRYGKITEQWASPDYLTETNDNNLSKCVKRPAKWEAALKPGDRRPSGIEYRWLQDGKVFWSYKRTGDATYEVWVTPERYLELKARRYPKISYRSRQEKAKPNTEPKVMAPQVEIPLEMMSGKHLLSQAKYLVEQAKLKGWIK